MKTKFENKSGKIIRVKPEKNFTMIPNAVLQNKELSLKAKGLLSIMLSMHDNWVIYKTTMQQFSTDGRDATISAFNELIKKNYIKQFTKRTEKGKFAEVYYIVSPIPFTDKSNSDNPISENPNSDNTELIKNKGLNTEGYNTELNKDCTSINYSIADRNTIDIDQFFEEINKSSQYRYKK